MSMTKKKTLVIGLSVVLLTVGLILYKSIDNKTYKLTVYEVNNGWGYSIQKQNKDYIVQNCIPAIKGLKAFPDKQSAKKTGMLVLTKLEQNNVPSITPQEIKEILENNY